MSSIFGHKLSAVYTDRTYAAAPSGATWKFGAVFALGAVCAVAGVKLMAAPSDGAQVVAAANQPVRVIAPDKVATPANVPAANPKVAKAPEPPRPNAVGNDTTSAAARDAKPEPASPPLQALATASPAPVRNKGIVAPRRGTCWCGSSAGP